MSIFPVRLAEWYPPGDKHHKIIKFIVSSGYGDSSTGCLYCKKRHMHWQKAYGDHSLPYGYGDMWCNERHFKKWLKRSYR